MKPEAEQFKNDLIIGFIPIWAPLALSLHQTPKLPEELSTRKFILRNGEETIVHFGKSEGKQYLDPFLEIYVGYRFHKFIGVFELNISNILDNGFSPFDKDKYFYHDRRLGSQRKGGEDVLISYITHPTYSFSLGYEIFSDFYLKLKGETSYISLIQARQRICYSPCKDPPDAESISIIYNDDIWTLSIAADYTYLTKVTDLAFILIGGLGWTNGNLTKGFGCYIGIGLGYRIGF
ncbi:MAG: hypothetical protein ABIG10_03500 [bacterium]